MPVTKVQTIELSPKRLALAGVLSLVAAVAFGTLAIDRGNLFYYALCVFSVFMGGRYLIRAASSFKK